jgi:hypothetical protein
VAEVEGRFWIDAAFDRAEALAAVPTDGGCRRQEKIG